MTYEKAIRGGLTRCERKRSILDWMKSEIVIWPRTARELADSQGLVSSSHFASILREMCDEGTISRRAEPFRSTIIFLYSVEERET